MELLYFIISLLTGFFGTVILSDMNRFHITHHTIDSDKIMKPLRIVVLADLHNKTYGENNEKLLKAIDQSHPDIIVMAGDMLNVKLSFSYDSILPLLKKLSEKYPVYYGMGNHEQRLSFSKEKYNVTFEQMKHKLQEAGAILLDNESIVLPEYGMKIGGLSIDMKFYSKRERHIMTAEDVSVKLGNADTKMYQLLIAHDPEYFKAYAAWGADLTLSGHLHGGVMRLPKIGGVISPRWKLFPTYTGGCYSEGRKKMIVSCGLGTHTIPVRVFNPGELVCIDFTNRKV